MNFTFGAPIAVAAAMALTSPSQAADKPSATATFSGGSVAAGVGYVWGDGTLTFNGKTYPFKAKGLTAVGVGAEKIVGNAEVYHLKSINDFPGVYAVAGAGGSVAKMGGGTAVLSNRHGVEIRMHTKDQGLELNVAASGVGISWAEKAK